MENVARNAEMRGGKKKKGKKKKGKKKKGKKKGKKKKGKKKGKKKKGGKKKKKEKKMPGEKLKQIQGVTNDEMLSKLVEDRIVKHYHPHRISELLGAFDYTDSKFQPSFSQIRQNLTEYAILPLGSSFLREHLPESSMLPKSILLYGPEGMFSRVSLSLSSHFLILLLLFAGSGKTMLAQAVASHTHALLLDLSPRNLQGKFESSKGPTALMHMVFKIAKVLHYSFFSLSLFLLHTHTHKHRIQIWHPL